MKGGASKCHLCDPFACESDTGLCELQLQGVDTADVATNIPIINDTPWGVGGGHRKDFGGSNVTHFCVFITGGECMVPQSTDFSSCVTRCFGYDTGTNPVVHAARNRTIVDTYPGMFKWPDDGNVDLWEYPRNCEEMEAVGLPCTYTGVNSGTPSFNPQGFMYTLAGNASAGFVDGPAADARFDTPGDIAVDDDGYIYIADTLNNAIRLVDPTTGEVSTVSGKGSGVNGFEDGLCSEATFASPKGLDVFINRTESPEVTVIIVADTGNHRLRRIDYTRSTGTCVVKCLTGLCGNNTLSETDFKTRAVPISGYADGHGDYSRFSMPEGVAIMDGYYIAVADTGNFLIRWVNSVDGQTVTLAGTIIPGPRAPDGNPLPGCTPPCMNGQSGLRDGNLTYAQFHSPVDLTRGINNSLYIVDENRVRLLELDNVITDIYNISSMGRVSTIAGDSIQGHEDGRGDEATFFVPSGVFVTGDNIAYVADAASCRIRRLTPLPLVSEKLTCDAQAVGLVRPSGCTSFDQQHDKIGRKISRVEKNIQYNYGDPYRGVGDVDRGKYMKNCVGVSPPDTLDKLFIIPDVYGENLVVDDHRVSINEDSEQGMAIMVECPSGCAAGSGLVEGTDWYSDTSSVCKAAIHEGVLGNEGGFIQITFQRKDFINGTYSLVGTTNHGITSDDMPVTVPRVFSFQPYNISTTIVHTVAGVPSALLESGCGFADGQPAHKAMLNSPLGIAASKTTHELTDTDYIYVLDSGNNMIRVMSAVCTQICENGGRCTKSDTCTCQSGWGGVDCTIPTCTTPCGDNKVCTAPDSCTCKPGYEGDDCDTPQCSQECHNGGSCSYPDTCNCPQGWFDSNCTTPVCTITCGNGGNCVAPDVCQCPTEWTGPDCRTPVCVQTCENDGFCVAPNTCYCTPQWVGHTCEVPVCTQGFFHFNGQFKQPLHTSHTLHWPTYKPCNLQGWCNSTNEFECDQLNIEYIPIEVPSGPDVVLRTGRKVPPVRCMLIELPTSFKIPFELLYADGHTTGYTRYSPNVPYESDPANPWQGYIDPTELHTPPWKYSADRQLAFVDWMNVSEGVYVCANGGNCLSPDVCECARGWGGFDCRTPICTQGYYHEDQPKFISGEETTNELDRFKVFFGNNSYRLDWPYSNPAYNMTWEQVVPDGSDVIRVVNEFGDIQYWAGADTAAADEHGTIRQGGYRCSIRSVTEWENLTYTLSHPNYFSAYMNLVEQADDKVYSYWEDMLWPPVTQRSRVLDRTFMNHTYVYTNEGYRRLGIWNITESVWEYGICMMEYYRTCKDSPEKQYDIESERFDVPVQDPDLAFRARLSYDDMKVSGPGRWVQHTGECIDEVIRGCYNNGTCIAPDVCRCADGWSGYDCTVPLCDEPCLHNGNCTLPNTCSCEKGWEGERCDIPICAQQCMNGGTCVAPDTCLCYQWPNEFRDARVGGRPLFMNPKGTPLETGWSGFDCSVPICVQAQYYLGNVDGKDDPGFVSLGGHGGDGTLECERNGFLSPRCPQYDVYVTGNEGGTFQAGCGYDPFDTGCCVVNGISADCFACNRAELGETITNETYLCWFPDDDQTNVITTSTQLEPWRTSSTSNNLKECKLFHSPRSYENPLNPIDYGEAVYYVDVLQPYQSSFNYRANVTSNRFLCNVMKWSQGDYIDDAGMGDIAGVGSIYGLEAGRHDRINFANYEHFVDQGGLTQAYEGPKIRGEGIYQCYNKGSCIGPDFCTCVDGYEGDDCNTPMCRHLQPSGKVSACLNGGVCSSKDVCECIQTPSLLWLVHPEASKSITGWTGTDCSMPMCSQGFFDPFCTNLPQAPGGEGCFRCANGGNCTAPDTCQCAEGWTGFDCKTAVCETIADPLTRTQLPTVFEDKILGFEKDPCGVEPIFGRHGWHGTKYTRGNCTAPAQCTCLCKLFYNVKACHKVGKQCKGPWQDPMVRVRNLLLARGVEFTFGSTDCAKGAEGNVDTMNRFTTCHQEIFYPSYLQESSIGLITGLSCAFLALVFGYYFLSVRLKRKYLLDKIARRRSKRSSEESLLKAGAGAFGHS